MPDMARLSDADAAGGRDVSGGGPAGDARGALDVLKASASRREASSSCLAANTFFIWTLGSSSLEEEDARESKFWISSPVTTTSFG